MQSCLVARQRRYWLWVQLKILCGGGSSSSSSSSSTTTRQAEKACVYFKKTRFICVILGLF
jgi:hypothetical protein